MIMMAPVTLTFAGSSHKPSSPELFNDFGISHKTDKKHPNKAKKGRLRSVKINRNLFWSDTLTLNLFDDTIVTIVRERVIKKFRGATTWIGYVEGYLNSEVFLTLRGQSLSGTVKIDDDLYEINLGKNGLHTIMQIDPDKIPIFEDDTAHVEHDFEVHSEVDDSSSSVPATANEINSAGTIIDVMVMYTSKAKNNSNGQPGIEAKILNAVAMANQAYLNSHIDMQINLVYMGETSYVESGNASTSLSDITSTSDGKMDEVHSLRNQYGADQVVLISADTNVCGTGYLMDNPGAWFASYAFSVVHDDSVYSCLSNHTLAHELGHNQGSHHDIESTTYSGAYAYSYGFRLCETGGFRTVMAYNCGTNQVGYFSNPNVIYNGEYTGTASANNALSINNTKSIVAAFRGSVDISTPDAPSNLHASALSDSEISITWNDNSENETGFRIERSFDGISWFEFASVGTNTETFTDNGLPTNSTFYYRVRAYNSNGNSTYSNPAAAQTHTPIVETCTYSAPELNVSTNNTYVAPGAPINFSSTLSNLDSSVCSANNFTLTTNHGDTVGMFTLSAGSTSNNTWATTAPSTDGNFSTTFTATANNHLSSSTTVSVEVDGTAPTTPANLTAEKRRKNQVRVSWGASSDSGSGISHYLVKRNGFSMTTTHNTSYTDRPGEGSFTYTVEAIDNLGNSSQANQTSITIGGGTGGGSNGGGKGRKK